MSEARKKRTTSSSPDALRVRMEKAHAEGRPVEIGEDEVTSVIDLALQKVRETGEAGAQRIRDVAQRLDTIPKGPRTA